MSRSETTDSEVGRTISVGISNVLIKLSSQDKYGHTKSIFPLNREYFGKILILLITEVVAFWKDFDLM